MNDSPTQIVNLYRPRSTAKSSSTSHGAVHELGS